MRGASARAALFEKNHAIRLRVEEASILRRQTRTWTTVQKHDRLAIRVAGLFVIEPVNIGDGNVPAVVGFDWVVKGSQLFHDARDYRLRSYCSANPSSVLNPK